MSSRRTRQLLSRDQLRNLVDARPKSAVDQADGAQAPEAGPLPRGFRVELDAATRELAPGVWYGGQPTRVLRLTGNGHDAWAELRNGAVRTRRAGVLARRLTDAGLAHPVPPRSAPVDATVLIPVRDRAATLDACLAALGTRFPVVVVDDGSTAQDAVEQVVAAHGATLIRRASNGGPAAARNTGLAHIDTPIIALLDSDCVPSPGWLERLAAHLADPAVAAAAPRLVALDDPRPAGRYSAARSALDLGVRPARVAPLTPVGYVPTAALVIRRAALPDGAFDEALRYGEDVDLVWRLHAAGWRIRYDPSVTVAHREPGRWIELLARRYHYGTSAGPLALRHPAAMPPLLVTPWQTTTVAALLAGRPRVAALTFAGSALALGRTLRRSGLPVGAAVRSATRAAVQSWGATARAGVQLAAPAILAAAALPGSRRPARRIAAAALLATPIVSAWLARRPRLDPIRFAAAVLADDVSYGLGVWVGAITARTAVPLRPVLARRAMRSTVEEQR